MTSPHQDRSSAERLNRECFCVTLDGRALRSALRDASGEDDFFGRLIEPRTHVFSKTPVFLPKADLAAMLEVVHLIESVAAAPGFRAAVAAWAPPGSLTDHGPSGVFMGYDFHHSEAGPKLIEINTNAGGAFLNAFLGRAQIACCTEVEEGLAQTALHAFDDAVTAMFEAEWRSQRRAGRPSRIAIVDDAPESQYLYPEFVLAERLFEQAGVKAAILDPSALRFEGDRLADGEGAIDLVYNRLVDFPLEEPTHAVLRAAYDAGAVVVTPNPFNHALFADKRNMTLLSDRAALAAWGVAETPALAAIPKAERVTPSNAEHLWARRKRIFFKPAAGYGSKAVYRGDKLTKTVWAEIVAGDYIAQELVPPTERAVEVDGERVQRKLDVRLYTYRGEMLLAAARLYQGQTTNFRTPGGGFAPVFFV